MDVGEGDEDQLQASDRSDGTGGDDVAAGMRKKATGVRAWLLLDQNGQARVLEAGKHAIMRRTGIPARDLRILNPFLGYPSTVLGRERAIVINLEHVKAIVTAHEVLLLNSKDPSVGPFIEELQRRILSHHQGTKIQVPASPNYAANDDADITGSKDLYELEKPESSDFSPPTKPKVEEDKEGQKQAFKDRDAVKLLPFEFVALEACLEAACSCLDNEERTLELEAHPALDKLTLKISTLNLERVRQIKSRLVALTKRVQKVRDELEHLLDDDDDMAEMYLTDKLLKQNIENSSISSATDQDGEKDDVLWSDTDDRIPANISLEANGVFSSHEGNYEHNGIPQKQLLGADDALNIGSHRTTINTTHGCINKAFDVEELEMLLEAYFVQIDGTLNKLSTLKEYVDDTEDYINIMLDDKQNRLLQMGVMLTTGTLVVTVYITVVNYLSINVHIPLFQQESDSMQEWLWTIFGCSVGCIALYLIMIGWCKHRGLLE